MDIATPPLVPGRSLSKARKLRSGDISSTWLRFAKTVDSEDQKCDAILNTHTLEPPSTPVATLLSLPVEIREIILAHVLTVLDDEDLSLSHRPSSKTSRLAVLLVCTQLHDEGLPLFYGRNRLSFALPLKLFRFLEHISKRRRILIRRISVGGWSYARYPHYELSKKAFAMLSLCLNLQELRLCLESFQHVEGQEDPVWELVFALTTPGKGRSIIPTDSALTEEWVGSVLRQAGLDRDLVREMACAAMALGNLRGLRTIDVTYRSSDEDGVWGSTLVNEMPGPCGRRWLDNLRASSQRPRTRTAAAWLPS